MKYFSIDNIFSLPLFFFPFLFCLPCLLLLLRLFLLLLPLLYFLLQSQKLRIIHCSDTTTVLCCGVIKKPQRTKMDDDEVIFLIPIRDGFEFVRVSVAHDIKDEQCEDIVSILAQETAPLKLWLAIAVYFVFFVFFFFGISLDRVLQRLQFKFNFFVNETYGIFLLYKKKNSLNTIRKACTDRSKRF